MIKHSAVKPILQVLTEMPCAISKFLNFSEEVISPIDFNTSLFKGKSFLLNFPFLSTKRTTFPSRTRASKKARTNKRLVRSING